ncbi:MAG: ABC transporter permease [Verrucomicrobia bacterium]|nr:ABC transporter permease [Verrucomicrobiota bacterium]
MIVRSILRNLRLGVKDILLHKARSLLTTLGVVFGVGSVIAMLAVGEGASRDALAEIRKVGSRNIIIVAQKDVDEEGASRKRTRMSIYGLKYEDEARIREMGSAIVRTVPVRLMRREAMVGERRLELRVVGTAPDWFDLVPRRVVAGRVLQATDAEQNARVCVLTESGARRLLAGEHSLGEKILIGHQYFEVVGVVESGVGGRSIAVPDEEVDAYIPMSTQMQLFGEVNARQTSGSLEIEKVELHQILVEVDADESVEPMARAIEAMLRAFHARKDYRMNVPLALLRQAEKTKRTFNIVLGSIAGISLLVGGIGIMNIMLASVTERTREIGVRRAIGARRSQIVVQFLIETMVLAGSGGVIGIGVGILIPALITRFSGMPTVVPAYSLVLSFGISVAIGLVFGIYPAVRAARLDPIVALRHE